MSASNTSADTLRLWEQAAGLDSWRRDDALLRSLGDPPQSLGARNVLLVTLRTRLFGSVLRLRSDCPECNHGAEFDVDCDLLARDCMPKMLGGDVHEVDVDGTAIRFRVPTADDLRQVACGASADEVEGELLQRCLVDSPSLSSADLPPHVRSAVSERVEQLDPGAVVSFSVQCPDCGHQWDAPLDVGAALWAELRSAAEQILLEIDALARAYGWSEPQILALGPTRRAAYLQLAGAA